MPNRLLKDSIAKSEKISALNDFQFRLWVHLITYVDDYGRGDARPAIIKGSCFPFRDRLTNKDIEKGLADLAGAGCVVLYEVDGRPYLYFPNWEKHQRVRTKVSKCPPPDGTCHVAADCGELPQNAARIQNPESRIQNPNTERFVADEPPKSNAKPTVDEVAEYCRERGNSVDPQRFVDYYTANGWRVGKNPMKDWRAAVRTWEKTQTKNTAPVAAGSVDPFTKKAIEKALARSAERRGDGA